MFQQYHFDNSWEEPIYPVLVKSITDNYIEVQWLGEEDNEEILTEQIPYKV